MAIGRLFRCILQNHKTALHHPRRHFYSIGDNIIRILGNELTYLLDYKPPLQPPKHYKSYTITDTAGSQWVRFKRYDPYRNEHVKIDATMFDGLAPIPEHLQRVYEGVERLHSSVTVEVRKGEEEDDDEGILVIVCSAWPESIEVKKVFPVKKGSGKAAKQPNMGRNFKWKCVKWRRDEIERGGHKRLVEWCEGAAGYAVDCLKYVGVHQISPTRQWCCW